MVTALDFKGFGRTEFPREVFAHEATLEFLDLSGNQIESLPDDLGRLKRLRILFASGNPIRELPESLGDCLGLRTMGFRGCGVERIAPGAFAPSLEAVILTGNRLRELPPEIGRCRNLRKLMLTGNALTGLPASLEGCAELELLRVAANQMAVLPDWLTRMPKLAWLALGGNPVCTTGDAGAAEMAEMAEVSWDELELQGVLGQGASGVVHQALWRRPGSPDRPVAVKVFKGGLSSDGWPSSEIAASLAAGRHRHLVPVLGRIAGHPEGAEALVMERIERSFESLAGPPSLETVTRDIYPEGRRFSAAGVWRIAYGIAGAAAHLHARGILHGDLYAHNLLWHPADHGALLGDLGAASMLALGGASSSALQRLDVRAFGLLLGELLGRAEASARGGDWDALQEVQAACVSPEPESRPTFEAILRSLRSSTVAEDAFAEQSHIDGDEQKQNA